MRQHRFLSDDSAKAIKAREYGSLNAIQYLAPAATSGFQLCSHLSAGCAGLCLGKYSGQASMVADLENGMNSVRESRIARARMFMENRVAFMTELHRQITGVVRKAGKHKLALVVRLNGATDIAWEGVRYEGKSMMEHFPNVQFVDYTKNHTRFARKLPPNYHLTFSRSETNEAKAIELLGRGVNVAVVFAGPKPATWHGFECIDGDKHDLRHLDPKGARGVVVALSPKGGKAKRDTSGFVVRQAA